MKGGDEVFLCIIKSETESRVRIQAQPILEEYKDVFPDDLPSLPSKRKVDHAIDLEPGGKVPNLPTYWMSHNKHEELFKQLQEFMSKGFISQGTSYYASPVLFAKKKGGTLCLCVDYRARACAWLAIVSHNIALLVSVSTICFMNIKTSFLHVRLHRSRFRHSPQVEVLDTCSSQPHSR